MMKMMNEGRSSWFHINVVLSCHVPNVIPWNNNNDHKIVAKKMLLAFFFTVGDAEKKNCFGEKKSNDMTNRFVHTVLMKLMTMALTDIHSSLPLLLLLSLLSLVMTMVVDNNYDSGDD